MPTGQLLIKPKYKAHTVSEKLLGKDIMQYNIIAEPMNIPPAYAAQ